MPISHVCNSCGFDLARVMPAVDESLRLPIVVCPTCSNASVRRRHPVHAFWRKARRMDAALSILLVQALFTIGLVSAIVGMVIGLSLIAGDRGEGAAAFLQHSFDQEDRVQRVGTMVIRNDDGRDAAVVATALMSAIAGIWLTATMSHLGLLRRWVTWAALLAVVISLPWVGWVIMSTVSLLTGEWTRTGTPDVGLWVVRVQLLGACLVVMLIAAPVGLPVRWLIGLVRGVMWRRQLRRARFARGRDH